MILHPYIMVRSRQYYKIFTSEFVHIDLQHFIVNELSLFFVGGDLERHLRHVSGQGSLMYMSIYLASLLIGNAIVIWTHKNNIEYSCAGASGSIMGCMFSFMLLEPNKVAFYLPLIGGVKNEFDAVIYFLLMVALRTRIGKSGVSYELHFWGALGGILMTVLLFPAML